MCATLLMEAGSSPGASEEWAAAMEDIRDTVRACMQCGTCTASCPNAHAMDLTPRSMWRMLLMSDVDPSMTDEVLASHTFWMCSACYNCTLRCPRGLELTKAVYGLKRLARALGAPGAVRRGTFYDSFTRNVRSYGRVQEMALMMRYFLARRDPTLPFKFTPMGLKMLAKGKLHTPSSEHKGRLDALFDKVAEIEGRTEERS